MITPIPGSGGHIPVIGLNSLTDPKTWSKAKYLGPFKHWSNWNGRIEKIIANPCSPTPEIWVLAFWTAIPTLVWSPLKPSAVDAAIRRLGARHGGKPGKEWTIWAWEQASTPEPAEHLYWARFTIGIGARALWYLALVDATFKFTVRWLSLVYQFAGCRYDGEGFCQMSQPGGIVLVGPLNDARVTLWEVDGEDIFVGGPTAIDVPIGYSPSVSYVITAIPWPVAPDQFKQPIFRLVDDATGLTVATSQNVPHPGGGNEQTGMFYGVGQGTLGHEYSIHVDMEAGYALLASGHFNAFGAGKKNDLLPDP